MRSVPGAVATGSQLNEHMVCQDVTRSLPLPVLTPSRQRQIKTLPAYARASDSASLLLIIHLNHLVFILGMFEGFVEKKEGCVSPAGFKSADPSAAPAAGYRPRGGSDGPRAAG